MVEDFLVVCKTVMKTVSFSLPTDTPALTMLTWFLLHERMVLRNVSTSFLSALTSLMGVSFYRSGKT